MRIVDYMRGRGISPDRFLFMPTNKTFGFGGDASRQADWSVRLPVYIGGRTGYMECFVVEGNTPLLVGRPILQALKLKMDYDTNKMSIGDGPWTTVTQGEKGEFLLRLDDGVENDPDGNNVDFDYVTDETFNAITNYEDLSDYIDIHEYLATTNRSGPEIAFQMDEDIDKIDLNMYEPEIAVGDDPSEVRRPITSKLVKSLNMNFNKFSKQRRTVVEQALIAHEAGRKVFWEVYSGSANLSAVMAEAGWETMSFDYNTGWDFTRADHRRDFLKLLDATCPEFVWLAPPCTVWSSLQNLNIDTPEKQIALQADRDYEENTHLKMCKRAFQKQQREGRHAGLEQPKNARSWGTPTLMAVDGHDALFDQCEYGCVLPDENGDYIPIKKGTALRCTGMDMAMELTAPCRGGHDHLPIEGTSPGIGSRAAAAGEYQLQMCYHFKEAIERIFQYKGEDAFGFNESNDPVAEEIEAVELPDNMEESPADEPEQAPAKGVLNRLNDEDWQKAKRTVLRLHRNLGHPTKHELIRLLKNKNASSSVIEAAHKHECSLCDLHRRPTGVPVSSMPKDAQFNHRVQADTLWVTIPGQRQQQPVLMMSDCTTRLLAARHLRGGEKTEFIKHLERAWIRNFGPMRILQVDEHRAWSSDAMRQWCTENGVQLQISPGQSHTRLAILERRHQVTRRALNLFLDGNPSIASSPDALITALNYVVPQINRTPNVCGFSPVQWTLGYTPHVPGLLMEEQNLHNPATLDPSEAFMEKLRLKQQAVKATSEADMDRRLRRALLRKFMGQQTLLNTGDLCYYWRDAPAGSNAKLRWRGPATVIMREAGASGPNSDIYWLGHGTVLLRAAPEHVKAAQAAVDLTEKATDPLVVAKDALQHIRNRGVTHYVDLSKTNKRRRDEVDTDEEEGEDDRDMDPLTVQDLPPDRWQISDDGKVWTRIHNVPRQKLYVPAAEMDIPVHRFKDERITDVRRGGPNPEHLRFRDEWRLPHADRALHYTWTGTTTFIVDVDNMSEGYAPTTPLDSDHEGAGEPPDEEPPSGSAGPTGPSSAPGLASKAMARPTSSTSTPGHQHQALPPEDRREALAPGEEVQDLPVSPTVQSVMEPEPLEEPVVPSLTESHLPVPPDQQRLYQAPAGGETFAAQRSRYEQQESLLFKKPSGYGPARNAPENRPTPYSERPVGENSKETFEFACDVDVVPKGMVLPSGWTVEDGFLQLGQVQDEWILEGNYLTKRHYGARDCEFTPTAENCPIDLKYLTKQRITKLSNGQVIRDKWTRSTPCTRLQGYDWTGYTRFKIHASWRRQAYKDFYDKSQNTETIYMQHEQLSERSMSLADRLAFFEAKEKELKSFFENDVWVFDTKTMFGSSTP